MKLYPSPVPAVAAACVRAVGSAQHGIEVARPDYAVLQQLSGMLSRSAASGEPRELLPQHGENPPGGTRWVKNLTGHLQHDRSHYSDGTGASLVDSFTTVSGHLAREGLPLARSTGPFASRRAIIVTALLLGAWLAVVIFTASRHEFWRDEVRAFTLARAASSPFDIYGLIQHDGHPIPWYLILHVGTSLVDTPLVLPVTSIVIAFAAVVLFMLAAPFPLWIRRLFIFSALPVYEYSVMARNYGISMLLMFVAAVLYRTRAQHPVLLGLALALLANTNAHSAVLACLIAGFWAWDLVVDERTRSRSIRGRPLPCFRHSGLLARVFCCASSSRCPARTRL